MSGALPGTVDPAFALKGSGIDFMKLAKAFKQANSMMNAISPQSSSQVTPAMASPSPSPQALPTNQGSSTKKGDPYLQYLLAKIQNRRGI